MDANFRQKSIEKFSNEIFNCSKINWETPKQFSQEAGSWTSRAWGKDYNSPSEDLWAAIDAYPGYCGWAADRNQSRTGEPGVKQVGGGQCWPEGSQRCTKQALLILCFLFGWLWACDAPSLVIDDRVYIKQNYWIIFLEVGMKFKRFSIRDETG
jgi:hypothetical protein